MFNVFINVLNEGVERILTKFASDAKLGKVANTWEGREIKKELGRFDQKDEINWITLNQRNVL